MVRGKKSIMIGTREFPPAGGGIGHYCFNVAHYLQSVGWDVTVVATQPLVTAEEAAEFNACQSFRTIRVAQPPTALLKMLWRFWVCASCIFKYKPVLLFAGHPMFAWIFSCLAPLFRRPYIAAGHGSEYLAGFPDSFFYGRGYRNANGVINVSAYTDSLMQAAGIHPPSSVVIHNGATPEEFEHIDVAGVDALRERLGLSGKKILLSLGMVSKRKAQDTVIRAMPAILARHPDVYYLVVGRPENQAVQEEYIALAEECGVSHAVEFLGMRDRAEIPLLLTMCESLIITSRRSAIGCVEGFGIVVVEAALCGKPSIVTQGSGLVEAIQVGETGLAVPQDDSVATAEAVLRLLGDKGLLASMGERAKRRALAEQTWNQIICLYDEYLSTFLQAVTPR